MKFGLLILDLLPAYINFEVQSTDGSGVVTDPTGTPTVSIYEEGGADANFDNSQITGSPFTIAKINAKVGNYGVLVDKSLFTAGKLYRCLYELTVDGNATAKVEYYFAVNSSSFKSDVSLLATAAALAVVDGNVDSIKSDIENGTYGLSALKTLIDAIDTSTELQARFDEIKGAGWSDETLKAIKDVVDAFSTDNYNGSGY
jgi:hypothetical protein